MTVPSAGRTTRGRGRLLKHPTEDTITLRIPLTASGHIADADATTLLRLLLLYSPHLLQPARFRGLLQNALLTIHQDPTP